MELKIENLTKDFGDFTAVDHLSLTMTNGVYGLLGINGAGKTTLMRMLCTLLKPSEGSITYNGKDIFKLDADYRKLLGYLPQDFGLFDELTVEQFLDYMAALKGLRGSRAVIRQVIRSVNLEEKARAKTGKRTEKASKHACKHHEWAFLHRIRHFSGLATAAMLCPAPPDLTAAWTVE